MMTINKKSKSTVVFLGGGRITSALCAGLRLAGDRHAVVVYDRHPEKALVVQRESGVTTARDLPSALAHAAMLILAVRPGSVTETLAEVAACVAAPPDLCVSLAAGIPLAQLRCALSKSRWVRAMPSPVCRIGRGLTALCFDRGVNLRERSQVRALFGLVGQVVEVREPQFDAFTITYSPSHGYHALAVLAETGRRAGLDRKTAITAAAHALCDAVSYWREGGLDLEELLHEAATPGGTAAATMTAMNDAGFERVMRQGVKAGIAQARRNSKDK
ncbi:MAG TPA: pyrroline-5-carboxylate reductase dimerization domain-containing protein [Candidatus Binatia bacterium]|nr:pyrroline-5-carboxylate reductase dimerization domain-containing protein [Candidatus Binatia bacterium]